MPTYKLPPTPTPPATVSAPVDVDPDVVLFVICIAVGDEDPLAVTKLNVSVLVNETGPAANDVHPPAVVAIIPFVEVVAKDATPKFPRLACVNINAPPA